MNISIRPSQDSDKEFARTTYLAGYKDVVLAQFGNWDVSRQTDFFERKWATQDHSILSIGDRRCGFVMLRDNPAEIQLVELVIRPEFQGQGIGSTFLQQLIERAARRAVPIRLEVLHENRAYDLYQRLGFQTTGRTETHFRMERTANPDQSLT